MRKLLVFVLSLLLALPNHAVASRNFANSSDTLLGGTTAFPTTGSISFQTYVQFAQTDSTYHILFEILDSGNYFQILHVNDNNILIDWNNGTLYQAFTSTYTLTQNAWNTITCTWTNTAFLRFYLNGTKIAELNNIGTYSTTATWSIGNRSTGGFPWLGNISRVGVWNRELTSGEVTTLTGSTTTPASVSSGLIHEWDLCGAVLTDSVGTMNLTNSGPTVGADRSTCGGAATAARRRVTSH